MRTKPILITVGILVVLACVFLFIRSRYLNKPKTGEIITFLTSFDNQLKKGNTDSLLSYFENNKKTETLTRLFGVLSGRTGLKGKSAPLFKLTLDVGASKVKILNNELAEATIPIYFTHDSLAQRQTTLTLKIYKVSGHAFRIVQVDGARFMADYLAYNNFIRSKTISDDRIYSAVTLKAFETAKTLKAKYDSVVWFAHMGDKTFFYVVKGKWNMLNDINRDKDSVIQPYKMGLLNPDLKEIIPPDYDLIHNINGTFPGLVEVEKDSKRGFYDLDGKVAVPVKYDQVFPIQDDANLAVLRSGEDYFYLKKDMTVSEKTDLKINDFFPKIKMLSSASNLYHDALTVVTEYNSHDLHGAIYISPSYLTDLNMVEKMVEFKNPLRKVIYDDVHENYLINLPEKVTDPDNWLETSFYSIRDYFLGGRSEFYDKKNIMIVDKKKNRVFVQDIGTDYTPDGSGTLEGACNVNSIKAINDTLFEVKAGAQLWVDLYDSTKSIVGGTYYHYLAIKNNKLVELPDQRNFGFTKYIKMDDSYLNGCYNMIVGAGDFDSRNKTTINQITPEMLRYIRNEIYADYRYEFKDKRWQNVFIDFPAYNAGSDQKNNVSVDDSLTAIDKYNINWINQKLKGNTDKKLAVR